MSLEQRTKAELVKLCAGVVGEAMLLWSATGHRMEDWVDAPSALRQMQAEAKARVSPPVPHIIKILNE